MFKKFKYLFALIVPALTYYSLQQTGWRAYSVLLFSFFIVPMADFIFPASEENMNAVEEEMAKRDIFYDGLLYAIVPIHLFLLWTFLTGLSAQESSADRIGHVIAMGLACGVFGINVAHELGHRNSAFEQFLSKLLLLTTLYMHFFIEHNRGHHKNVSTEEDAASAVKGEMVYVFWMKSMIGAWKHAWGIEWARLSKLSFIGRIWKNEMMWYQIIQILFLISIAYFFSIEVLYNYLPAAFIGILLLETVNYIEHYGLRRKKSESGIYEKVQVMHSWNSNHPIGRILLFELTRHSDHHYIANRPFQLLRHFDQSPQMPAGYPAMLILSLCPPLWFKVMDKRVEELSNAA